MSVETFAHWYQDPAWVAAVASVGGTLAMSVAASITAWNAIIARKLLEETQRSREAQLVPTILVRFAMTSGNQVAQEGYLIVENLGPGLAKGVKASIDKSDNYKIIEHMYFSDLTPFVTAMDMKPGYKYKRLAIYRKKGASPGEGFPKGDLPVHITCYDILGRQHSFTYLLPQDPNDGYLDTGYSKKSTTRTPDSMDIANEVSALRQFLEVKDM